MKCKEIQELLLADYFDGEESLKEKLEVKEHLKQCLACGKLEQKLQAQRELLKQVKPEAVPPQVWQNIQQAIIDERLREEEANQGFLEGVKRFIWEPRPRFALASALAVILFITIFTGLNIQKKQSLVKQDETHSLADYSFSQGSSRLLNGFGTSIEESFL